MKKAILHTLIASTLALLSHQAFASTGRRQFTDVMVGRERPPPGNIESSGRIP